ncbi:unnamed protein product [Musa hybrid cultivar]
MYPSLFPIGRSWHPGASFPRDIKENELNALMWSRGLAAERGMCSLNLSSLGMGPWVQHKHEPLLPGSEFNKYQAISHVALQDVRYWDILKLQFLQNQQPIQFLPQSYASSSLLQHRDCQQTKQQIVNSQSQCVTEPVLYEQWQPPQNKQQVEGAHANTQAFPMHSNHVQQQSHFPPSLFESSSTHNSSLGFSSILTASSIQDILGFAYCEENAGGSNYSHLGQSMLNHPNWQSWKPKFTKTQPISFDDVALLPSLPAKNCTAGNEVFRVNLNNTLFSFGKDSSSSPTNAVPNLGIVNDMSSVPCVG